MTDIETFLERYSKIRFCHSGSLIPLLREGRAICTLRSDGDLPCSHYQRIYRDRADDVKDSKKSEDIELLEMFREFDSLAHNLKEAPDDPCGLWIFSTPRVRFSIFEIISLQQIAGGFMRQISSQQPTQ